jgi:succinate dehydrogenase / fumarate reductase, flavoprotein subunit
VHSERQRAANKIEGTGCEIQFQRPDKQVPDFDVLVVGGGVAGLRAAIAARRGGASVALVTKTHPLRTNSGLAAAGLNAPLGGDDSAAAFAQDTMLVGDGLSDPEAVRVFTEAARGDVLWLEQMGVPFNRDAAGKLDRRRFGANHSARTCYADDFTGHFVLQVVYEQFQRERMPIFSDWFLTSLVLDNGVCVGATALGLPTGALELFSTRAVILATGGFTRLYLPSTASFGTTGDGQNLAYLAGAPLMDMEMIQFHPTVFPGGNGLLITEAALADGAEIMNQKGEPIIQFKFDPREKLALSIVKALQNGNDSAALDMRPIGPAKLAARFPQTRELVNAVAGLDVAKQPIPIFPAAHRPIGGIETGLNGATSVQGLFAAGECACNGVNGAGRLAGNTLTEALVFGRRAGEAAAAYARSAARKNPPASRLNDEERRLAAFNSGGSAQTPANSALRIHAELGRLMNDKVGLMRDKSSLQSALDEVGKLKAHHAQLRVGNSSRIYNYELTTYLEIGAMLNLAELVITACQTRTESRGAHYRTDFAARDDAQWSRHTILAQGNGVARTETKPVTITP